MTVPFLTQFTGEEETACPGRQMTGWTAAAATAAVFSVDGLPLGLAHTTIQLDQQWLQ